jgi:hypothetical protein
MDHGLMGKQSNVRGAFYPLIFFFGYCLIKKGKKRGEEEWNNGSKKTADAGRERAAEGH